ATMVSSTRIFHQSTATLNPSRKCGLYTMPTVLEVDCSGSSVGLPAPEKNGTGVWTDAVVDGTKPCCSWRKVSARAPRCCAQFARTCALFAATPNTVSHGSA